MLENLQVNVKIKLSVLWTAVMFCYVYGDYFELYTPDKVEGLLKGVNILDTPFKLFSAAVVMAIPAFMIFLSILLKPKISRWLNIVFGTLFTLMMLYIIYSSLTSWYAFYVLLAVLESFITALIVWYALKWPKVVRKQ